MANARDQEVDKTYLSIDAAEERGFIHRDYIAHCLRWTHVMKQLGKRKQWDTARILDVGCGRELPFPKLLYSSKFIPERYMGVDAGPINEDAEFMLTKTGKFPVELYAKTDICQLTFKDKFTHAICFEVLEHIEPEHMLRLLAKVRESLTDNGTFFVSTPCWNRRDCAGNHVNEMTYGSLGAVFEENGWFIRNRYGTFASIRDYSHKLSQGEKIVFDRLREYYDTNFLSCIFAPLYPAQSRNCLWELSPRTEVDPSVRKFPALHMCKKPWGSSDKWEDMQHERHTTATESGTTRGQDTGSTDNSESRDPDPRTE